MSNSRIVNPCVTSRQVSKGSTDSRKSELTPFADPPSNASQKEPTLCACDWHQTVYTRTSLPHRLSRERIITCRRRQHEIQHSGVGSRISRRSSLPLAAPPSVLEIGSFQIPSPECVGRYVRDQLGPQGSHLYTARAVSAVYARMATGRRQRDRALLKSKI